MLGPELGPQGGIGLRPPLLEIGRGPEPLLVWSQQRQGYRKTPFGDPRMFLEGETVGDPDLQLGEPGLLVVVRRIRVDQLASETRSGWQRQRHEFVEESPLCRVEVPLEGRGEVDRLGILDQGDPMEGSAQGVSDGLAVEGRHLEFGDDAGQQVDPGDELADAAVEVSMKRTMR